MWNEHCCPALYTLSLKFRPVFYKHVAADDKHHVSSYHVPIPALLSMLGVQLHSPTSLFPLWTRSLGVLFCNLPIKWHVMMWRGNTWQKGSSNYKMGLGSWGQRGLPGSSAGKKKIYLQCRKPQFNSWIRRSPGEGIGYPLQYSWASLVAQLVKNLPAMQETWVPSLGGEDPLKKGMTTHSSILAWRNPRTV